MFILSVDSFFSIPLLLTFTSLPNIYTQNGLHSFFLPYYNSIKSKFTLLLPKPPQTPLTLSEPHWLLKENRLSWERKYWYEFICFTVIYLCILHVYHYIFYICMYHAETGIKSSFFCSFLILLSSRSSSLGFGR